ncbi:MAG: hypothetical protein OXI94_08330 [Gemmatimonadota bacterium]|nr:hypothetical protein [Gemmatimonadota bacterium]
MATLQPTSFQFSQWYKYDQGGIILHAPANSGLYAIVNIRPKKIGNRMFESVSWIYIGKDEESIRSRLLEHCRGKGHNPSCIAINNPTHFAFVSINKGPQLDGCEIASIKEYRPACNDQHT